MISNQGSSDMRVYCRFRPPQTTRTRSFENSRCDVQEKESVVANNYLFSKDQKTVRYISSVSEYSSSAVKKRTLLDFTFNKVFQPTASQEDVYTQTVERLLPELFQGFNCTVIAYGQTGSGKTYTMLGKGRNRVGVVPRVAKDIFHKIHQEGLIADVFVSGAEIYLEKVYDVLSNDCKKNSLKIRHSTTQKMPFVEKLTLVKVESQKDLLELIQKSQMNRVSSSTRMNECSSRSHSVFTITLKIRKPSGDLLQPSLVLVDLAGSEQSKKSGVLSNTILFQEAKLINKSLSALGNVIKALSEKKNFIPYRNSKLTRILQSSIGGNSKTCFILTCSSTASDVAETLSTLRFGKRAAGVVNKADIRISRQVVDETMELKARINTLEATNYSLIQKQMEAQSTINRLRAERIKLKEKSKNSSIATTTERMYKPRSISSRSMSVLSPTRIARYSSGKVVQPDKTINSITLPELDVSFIKSPKLETDTTTSVVHFDNQNALSPMSNGEVENALVELTKKMISIQAELDRKNTELEKTKALVNTKLQKTRFGFIRSSTKVETKHFAEIVKKKDDNIEELTAELRENKSQVTFLSTKYSALEVEKKTLEAEVLRSKGRIRFLEEALEQQR